jgi:diguanylate cyclase (GGDEF)-like protein
MVLLRNLRDSLAVNRSGRAEFKLAETLLKAIRDHAVAGHPADRERFRAQVAELSRRMVSTEDDAELLMIAGAAQQALRLYESETNGYWQAQAGELQGIVGAMTAALADFGARHSQAAGRLVQLEQSLESISQVEDLRTARHQIEECLTALRLEIEHQHGTQGLFTECLSPRPALVTDPVTGLASRRAAEVAIADRLKRNAEGSNLALFVIHRIQQVNSRYGHAVGDQMLKTFLQHIGASLRPADQLFRWSGPAILALVQRDDPLDAVVLEMRRIAGFKLDQELEIRDRSVMVPLSASVCLVGLTKAMDLTAMAAELDQFAASHLQR